MSHDLINSKKPKRPQLPTQPILFPLRRPHRRTSHIIGAQRAQADIRVVSLVSFEHDIMTRDDLRGVVVVGLRERGAGGGGLEVLEDEVAEPLGEEGLAGHLDVGLAQAPEGVEGAQLEVEAGVLRGGGDLGGGEGAVAGEGLEPGLQVRRFRAPEHVGVGVDEAGPALGPDHPAVAVRALAHAHHVHADVHFAAVPAVVPVVPVHGHEGHEARLVADVEGHGLPARAVFEHGFPVRVRRELSLPPRHAAVFAHHPVLEQVGRERHLGVR